MNKIDELVKEKFWFYDQNQKEKLSSNTKIKHFNGYSKLFLFENLIATNNLKNKTITINFHGYVTKTTKNRLNAILSEINYHINYFKKMPLLNNKNFIPTNDIYKINYT